MNRSRLLIATVSLPLLITGINWGLPRAVNRETIGPWGYDEVAPLEPLSEARYLFTRPESEYLAYPLFHYMLLTLSYSPYLFLKELTGDLVPAYSYPYGMYDPIAMCRDLTIIARVVSIIMAVGVVLIVYELARMLFDRRSALWAATMTAVLPSFVYYGKTSNLDIPYIFWVMLTSLLLSKILMQGGRVLHYILFGTFSALAVCTKDQAVGYIILYPAALAADRWRREGPAHSLPVRIGSALFGRPMLWGLVASALAFMLANNLVFGWNGFLRHLQVATEMSKDYRMFPPNLIGQSHLALVCFRHTALTLGPALALTIIGLTCLLAHRRWKILAIALLPIMGHHVFIIARVGYVFLRFLIASSIFCVILGAGAIHYTPHGRLRRMIHGLGLLSLIYGAIVSADLDYALVRDARYRAEDWITRNVPIPSTFEAYTMHQGLLPRVWDRHRVRLIGVADMTAEGIRSRGSDYIIITDLQLNHLWQHPDVGRFLRRLFDGNLGYKIIADFKTIGILNVRFDVSAHRVVIFRKVGGA